MSRIYEMMKVGVGGRGASGVLVSLSLVAGCATWLPAPRPAEGAAPTERGEPGVRVPAVANHPTATGATVAPASAPASASAVTVARDTVVAKARLAPDSLEVSPAEIVVEAKRVFGDAVAVRTDSAAPVAPTWDIDVRSYETHARVEYFVKVFSGRAREPFAKAMQRQTRYGPLIRGALRDGGLPEDLIYLALIESWYDPHAYSKAAAVGMWQFMARTARGAGLRVDWWVDERRDPVRSTQGAVRFLRELRDQFGGSIYLAAAAYDGGDGRIARGLARYRSDLAGVEGDARYFTLAGTKFLRAETRDYVPKIIAAALVGKEPARYGVTVDSVPALAFDSVLVAGGTPIVAVGNASGASLALMKELNPHLLRGATPPNEPMWVRVPARSAAAFDDRFAALDSNEARAFTRVESKKGESMASIAKKHALTAKQLAWYNPNVTRLKSGNLAAGQRVLVPSRSTVAAALDVPDPSIEKFPRRAKATAKKSSAKRATAKSPSKGAAAKSSSKGAAAKSSSKGPKQPSAAARRKAPSNSAPSTKAPAKKKAAPAKDPAKG